MGFEGHNIPMLLQNGYVGTFRNYREKKEGGLRKLFYLILTVFNFFGH